MRDGEYLQRTYVAAVFSGCTLHTHLLTSHLLSRCVATNPPSRRNLATSIYMSLSTRLAVPPQSAPYHVGNNHDTANMTPQTRHHKHDTTNETPTHTHT